MRLRRLYTTHSSLPIFLLILSFSQICQTLITYPLVNPQLTSSLSTSSSSSKPIQDVLQLLKCFHFLNKLGNRITLSHSPISEKMIIMDSEGNEVSCEESNGVVQFRSKSDRSCLFSPIHCLFKKRLQATKIYQNNNRISKYQ